MLEKSLHAGNLAAAFGVIATTADLTLTGGAATMFGAALSGVAIFKSSDRATKKSAKAIAADLDAMIEKTHLSADQETHLRQLVGQFPPADTDFVDADMNGTKLASLLVKRIKEKSKDAALTSAATIDAFYRVMPSVFQAAIDRDIATNAAQSEMLKVLLERTSGTSGVAEGLLKALAIEYAEGETDDVETAYRGLKAALETAKDMAARAALPDNTDSAMSAIRVEVQKLNDAEKLEEANARISEAIGQKQAEVAALLDLGLQQDRIRNDPQSAAKRAFERVRQDGATDLFNALRQEWMHWYEAGRDKGLPFDAIAAIHLAELSKQVAKTADEKGAALNFLGLALQTLGERESDTARLEQAVDTYTDALLEYTRDRVPLDWAATKNNLGNALAILGKRENGTARLEQAVDAYADALLEYTRDRVPLNWATTKNNLGNALQTLGERDSDTARLEQAVDAYTDALLERTRDRVPLDWAMTKNNLGGALANLGKRDSDTARLAQAVDAHTDALLERPRERVPFQWALTQENLAILQLEFFEKTGDAAYLDQAAVHAKDAQAVYVEAQSDFYIAKIERLIAKIQSRRNAL